MYIRKISIIRKYLTDKAVKTLVQSIVISRLDYNELYKESECYNRQYALLSC